MSDDMLVHFSSNSSNQSDQSLPTKIAKLEARMVGKASSTAAQQPGWSSVTSAGKFSGAAEELPEPSTSSDSDDDVSHSPIQCNWFGGLYAFMRVPLIMFMTYLLVWLGIFNANLEDYLV